MNKAPNAFVICAKPARFADLIPGAASLADTVCAVFVGSAAEAGDVFAHGAGRLCLLPAKSGYIFEDYAPSIAAAIKAAGKSVVLLPNDRRGKAMAAKLGALLKAAVVNDVMGVEEDGSLAHMVYGGLAVGRRQSLSDVTIMTVGGGVFEPVAATGGQGETVELGFVEPAARITLVEVKPKACARVDIAKARRIVSVGRGFARQEDLSLAKSLASAIDAELACSRPIAEGELWMERERYVGVSGAMVKADVYLAVGISGQIQHMVGARDCKTIVAINKDKNAAIFKFADYGIVGDLYKVLPALTKALKN